MRTIRTKVYKFQELSKAAQEKAIQWYLYTDTESFAWDDTKSDAAEIGLSINEISQHRQNKGSFKQSGLHTAHKILDNHYEECETYKTAAQFIQDWNKLVEKYSDGKSTDKVAEENEQDFDTEADDLEKDFLYSLLEDYRILYENEREYESSEEYARIQIEANKYEFLQDGTIYN